MSMYKMLWSVRLLTPRLLHNSFKSSFVNVSCCKMLLVGDSERDIRILSAVQL